MEYSQELLCDLPLLAASLVMRLKVVSRNLMAKLEANAVPQEEIQEAIIQTYLFDGYPTALEGLFLLSDYYGDSYQLGAAEAVVDESLKNWLKKGQETCKIIYGENYRKLLNNVNSLSPDLANWMLIEGYGKVLSRTALELKIRELINVAVLTVKDYPRQLHSHLIGAVNAGAEIEDVDRLLARLDEMAPVNSGKAKILWEEICKDRGWK